MPIREHDLALREKKVSAILINSCHEHFELGDPEASGDKCDRYFFICNNTVRLINFGVPDTQNQNVNYLLYYTFSPVINSASTSLSPLLCANQRLNKVQRFNDTNLKLQIPRI